MKVFRHHLLRHRATAALLIACALLIRVLVPTGFMPNFSSGHIQISICTGYGPMKMTMPGMDRQDGKGDHDKGAVPCGFDGLLAQGLAGTDPIQLAIALVFIMIAALFSAPRLFVDRAERLRPPLRGPPLRIR